MMSEFGGNIRELENVLIDNFVSHESHTCFFLSHCHSDHMSGLSSLFQCISHKSQQYLYCSPITRLILLNKFNISNENFIKELTFPKVITVPGNAAGPTYQVTVTPIPAGHCPGSVMFLFQAVNTTVLYTGDFRIYKGDISKFKALHSKQRVKTIDKLYFDSTFLNVDYWEFPLRSEVVKELLELIVNWVKKSPEHNVLLETCASYGYEDVFAELGRKLKSRIHVKDCLYKVYRSVPEVGTFLSNKCTNSRVHAVGIFDKKCAACRSENVLKIRLSAQWYKSGNGINRKDIWKETSKGKILMCYSTHSSCSELVDFLSHLQPKSLEPCCVAVGSTEESMKRYLEDLKRSWPPRRSESPEPLERNFPLEKSYNFRVKLPSNGESSPERKKKALEETMAASTQLRECPDQLIAHPKDAEELTDGM